MFGLRISLVSYVKQLATPLLKFWNCDLSFLGNRSRDDPVYQVNGKSGCYNYHIRYNHKLHAKELPTTQVTIDIMESNIELSKLSTTKEAKMAEMHHDIIKPIAEWQRYKCRTT